MTRQDIDKGQAGFTLIEVLLAIVIGGIVLGLAINFFSQGEQTYTKAQKKIDAQSQLRLAMTHIKRELSVATSAEIFDTPGVYDGNFFYFYVNNNTMVLTKGITPQPLPGCLPLPGLGVTFSVSPHQLNIVRVHMTSEVGEEYNSDILIQNITTSSSITGNTTGTAIKFTEIN